MKKISVVAIAASLFGAPLCDAHAGSNMNGVFGFLSSNGTFRPLGPRRPPQNPRRPSSPASLW
jgi:hypothetical protein